MGFSLLFEEQNREVGRKLFKATFAMFTIPIAVFFAVQALYMNNNNKDWSDRTHTSTADTYAGCAAVVMTNIIIATYCYQAYIEDKNDPTSNVTNPNDPQPPRVGAFKTRID